MKKKLMASMLMMGMLLTSPTITGYAANTSDTIYRVNVNTATGDFKTVQERDKQNNSKVYVKVTSSPYKYVHVQTHGNRNTSTYYNETVGVTATVQRGVASSITNYCYEHKKSNYTYVLVRLKLRSGSSSTGWVEGVWSPDSTKNYTVVN